MKNSMKKINEFCKFNEMKNSMKKTSEKTLTINNSTTIASF